MVNEEKPQFTNVRFLSSNSYRRSIRLITETHNLEPVHLADIELSGRVQRMYLKYYPDPTEGSGHRGMINEIIGFVLAERLGLPQPKTACLVNCKSKVLHRLLPDKFHNDESEVTLWGVEAIDGKTPAQHFNLASHTDALLTELFAWKGLEETISFDDWLANTDRHQNNLIRTKKNRYHLIDHGWLFGGMKWTDRSLKMKNQTFKNQLEILTRTDDTKKEEDRRNKRCFISEKHEGAYQAAEQELKYWFDLMLNSKDAELLDEFIIHRADNEIIKSRLGVM